MRFQNREEAGKVLAQRLAEYKKEKPVVLAIPKGALPLGSAIAEVLNSELDVVLVKKIGAPNNPELVIGALSESGDVYFTEMGQGLSHEYLEARMRSELKKISQKRKQYGELRPRVNLNGRTVIIVDDGIATGATMLAAIKSTRHKGAKKIVVATVVAPPETVRHLREEADEVIVIYTPTLFSNVGEFFDDFSQVTDKEVKDILRDQCERSHNVHFSEVI
jgi:putative phosphoribosyl transferase